MTDYLIFYKAISINNGTTTQPLKTEIKQVSSSFVLEKYDINLFNRKRNLLIQFHQQELMDLYIITQNLNNRKYDFWLFTNCRNFLIIKVPSYQLNINTFLMQELKKLKDDQERLNSEILSLKIQNLKLR